jgi:hypothetical protein
MPLEEEHHLPNLPLLFPGFLDVLYPVGTNPPDLAETLGSFLDDLERFVTKAAMTGPMPLTRLELKYRLMALAVAGR